MSYHGFGSYFQTPPKTYQPPPPALPGWELAPVPGWGMNPERSGPPILAMNGSTWPKYTPVGRGVGDSESDANQGYVAIAAASGLFLGMFLAWMYWYNMSPKKARSR